MGARSFERDIGNPRIPPCAPLISITRAKSRNAINQFYTSMKSFKLFRHVSNSNQIDRIFPRSKYHLKEEKLLSFICVHWVYVLSNSIQEADSASGHLKQNNIFASQVRCEDFHDFVYNSKPFKITKGFIQILSLCIIGTTFFQT